MKTTSTFTITPAKDTLKRLSALSAKYHVPRVAILTAAAQAHLESLENSEHTIEEDLIASAWAVRVRDIDEDHANFIAEMERVAEERKVVAA